MKMKTSELPEFDPSSHLKDEEDIALYLEAIREENAPELLKVALLDVERARERIVPNAETQKAMAEGDEILRNGGARFSSAEEMFAELNAGRPVPAREAAKHIPEVAEALRQLKCGELSLSTDPPETFEPWTEEEKQRFYRIMGEIKRTKGQPDAETVERWAEEQRQITQSRIAAESRK
jgi:hypothetical protein